MKHNPCSMGAVVIRVNLFVHMMCRDMVILLGSALEPLLLNAPDVSQLAPKWTATKEFLWNSLQEEISPPIPLQSPHLEYHLGRSWLPPRDRSFLVIFCYIFSKALIWGRLLDVKSAHLLSSVVHLHLRGSRQVSGAWATFLIPLTSYLLDRFWSWEDGPMGQSLAQPSEGPEFRSPAST